MSLVINVDSGYDDDGNDDGDDADDDAVAVVNRSSVAGGSSALQRPRQRQQRHHVRSPWKRRRLTSPATRCLRFSIQGAIRLSNVFSILSASNFSATVDGGFVQDVFVLLERCNPWPHVANRHISQLLSL